ncbi:MAG: hypothetical protein IT356_04380 [Gemmatimonadaceae bacterium]|nr:hypothetical protein [Gemmatimonadaceae bacterium]
MHGRPHLNPRQMICHRTQSRTAGSIVPCFATALRRPAVALALCALAAQAARAQQAQPSVSVSGVVYAHYAFQLSDTANHANAFDITRALMSVNGKFAGGLTARVSSDIYRAADSSTVFRLKFAYLAWTPDGSHLTYRFGLTQTLWIDYADQLWDYRMQGPTVLDRNGILFPADFGAAVDGSFRHDGLTFQAGIYDGEGYARGTGDRHKDVSARASVRLLDSDDSSRVGGLRLTAFALLGTPSGGGTRNRYTGQVSWRARRLTLGGEFTIASDSVRTARVTSRESSAISAFGVLRLSESKAALVLRTDIYDPNTGKGGDRQTRFIAGVSYQVTPNWRTMLDLDRVSYEGTPDAAQQARRSTLYFHNQLVF